MSRSSLTSSTMGGRGEASEVACSTMGPLFLQKRDSAPAGIAGQARPRLAWESELEPRAEPDAARGLIGDHLAEVRVFLLESHFRVVVVALHTPDVEQVEHVRQDDEPAPAEMESVVAVQVEVVLHRCARFESVDGLEALAAGRLRNLTG